MNLSIKHIFERLKSILVPSPKFSLTDEWKQYLSTLENTNQNTFITGKAGTGKSTFIRYFRSHTKKSVVVVAPTGIAAFNIGGQTIHSFFKFPPHIINKNAINNRIDTRMYTEIDTLIIDEISMVRADVLDGIDLFLRKYGRNKNLPFGGIQVIIVGDLYQLPPVVTKKELGILLSMYESPNVFNANVYKLANFIVIELTTIFRQTDNQFIDILNKIRINQVDNETLQPINERVSNKGSNDHIVLTTTNGAANGINESRLELINEPSFTYVATTEGIFPLLEQNMPVPFEIELKKGAQVMFVKNDRGGRWINGTLGKVFNLNKEVIKVQLNDHTKQIVKVPIEEWENINYVYDEETEEMKPEVIGKLRQFPLRLAWAITIHKSQGMTFSKVKVDFSISPFAHGQTYVALSRCRNLKGLQLTRKIWPNDILIDPEIIEFYRQNLKTKELSSE